MKSLTMSRILLLAAICLISFTLAEENEAKRKGKLYVPLFSIVTFKNEVCKTAELLNNAGNQASRRAGTCLTKSECSGKSGVPSGSCAAGFGVCCLFIASASDTIIDQNCSYIQNPGFPSPYTNSDNIRYAIRKCSSDVCYLRLDFESFNTLGIGSTIDAATGGGDTPDDDDVNECRDKFDVTVSSGQNIPTICGQNTGQHMFVDLGGGPSDAATLNLEFTGTSNRVWDIKVTQYKCGDPNAPRNGCLQWFTGLTGRVKTYNYDATGDNHLPNQQYSACIRQENGYCCVEYTLCQDTVDTAFSLSITEKAMMDSNCLTEDYVGIADSSLTCNQNPGAQLASRYCGNKLHVINEQTVNVPICDCTAPFSLDIVTNAFADVKMGAPAKQSRGLCLDYKQIPCTG